MHAIIIIIIIWVGSHLFVGHAIIRGGDLFLLAAGTELKRLRRNNNYVPLHLIIF